MRNASVFIVDDDQALRESLCALVSTLGWRTECYSSAEEFLSAFDPGKMGCLILDLRLPEMSGLDLQRRLIADGISIPLIMLTGHGSVTHSVSALRSGAFHFLEKPFPPNDLVQVIREAIELDMQQKKTKTEEHRVQERLNGLCDEEFNVLAGLVLGKTNAEIAASLDLSPRTAQFRRSSLMEKLGVTSKRELMEFIFAAGWQPPLDDFQESAASSD